MNLPNKITILRILLIPIFIVLLYVKVRYIDYIAALVFIILALTDALDGYMARKRKEVTRLGKLIDPLADKLLISAALIFLIGKGVSAWMAFVIIAREFAVTGLRLSASAKDVTIAASKFGKVKTISQIVAIVAVIINFPFNWWLMLIAVILTLVSGVDYFIKARRFLEE
jgi:CDP-diacylglycerol--glycerol-3-phosphate 3-phosphatidyltransferase